MEDLAGFVCLVALLLSFLSGVAIEGKSRKEGTLKVLGQSVEEISKLKE